MGYRPLCPNCESSLAFIVERDEETNKINFIITCEWCDEYEGFMIKTDIEDRDIEKLAKLKRRLRLKPKSSHYVRASAQRSLVMAYEKGGDLKLCRF